MRFLAASFLEMILCQDLTSRSAFNWRSYQEQTYFNFRPPAGVVANILSEILESAGIVDATIAETRSNPNLSLGSDLRP